MIEINERPLRLCWKSAEWKVEHYVRTLTAYEQKHHGQLTVRRPDHLFPAASLSVELARIIHGGP